MVYLLVFCSVLLGVLGIAMGIYAVYLVQLNLKLEFIMKEKNDVIVVKEAKIKEISNTLKEQEGFVSLLREQIRARDRQISALKRR